MDSELRAQLAAVFGHRRRRQGGWCKATITQQPPLTVPPRPSLLARASGPLTTAAALVLAAAYLYAAAWGHRIFCLIVTLGFLLLPLVGIWLWSILCDCLEPRRERRERRRRIDRLRATSDRLELHLGGRWRRFEWSEVTTLQEAQSGRWLRMIVGGHVLWLFERGSGRLIGQAARLAQAHYAAQRRLAESVPEGALSAADEPAEGEDRGLSRADA